MVPNPRAVVVARGIHGEQARTHQHENSERQQAVKAPKPGDDLLQEGGFTECGGHGADYRHSMMVSAMVGLARC
jgi:hypothetical protein